MKYKLYIVLGLLVFLLAGCSPKDQMANIIVAPTPTPSAEEEPDTAHVEEGQDNENEAGNEEEAEDEEPIVVGATITKFVKLNKYNDTLNVRAEPSTNGAKVGFLVHAEKVEVIDIVDGWARFVKDNKYVYCSADYLVDEKPEYLQPPTSTPSPTPDPNENISPEI